jgi:hypothetical protein
MANFYKTYLKTEVFLVLNKLFMNIDNQISLIFFQWVYLNLKCETDIY